MLVGLLAIFAVLIFLSFVEDYLGKYKWFAFLTIGVVLMVYAGVRPVGFDRDSPNYETMFMHPDSRLSEISVEPFFLWICNVCSLLMQDVRIILVLFAIVGVTLKMYAIKKLTPMFFLPLVIYFGNFYFLHEITQIRAGVAAAIFLISVYYMSEGRKLVAFGVIAVACMFHYSALSLFPLLFLDNKPMCRVKKMMMASIVPMCFLLYFLNLDLLTTIPIPYVTDKVEGYKAASEFGAVAKNSILNPFPLIKMVVFLFLLYFADTVERYVPSIHLLIKILGCSLVVYFAFSSITIISIRISELYGIVELVAYPCIAYTIRPKAVGTLFVCMIAIIEMVFNTIMWGFFDFAV